jgi:hypothetical protein
MLFTIFGCLFRKLFEVKFLLASMKTLTNSKSPFCWKNFFLLKIVADTCDFVFFSYDELCANKNFCVLTSYNALEIFACLANRKIQF